MDIISVRKCVGAELKLIGSIENIDFEPQIDSGGCIAAKVKHGSIVFYITILYDTKDYSPTIIIANTKAKRVSGSVRLKTEFDLTKAAIRVRSALSAWMKQQRKEFLSHCMEV